MRSNKKMEQRPCPPQFESKPLLMPTANSTCSGGSYFFKVMWGNFREALSIPPEFVKNLRSEGDTAVTLEGPTGQKWRVYLRHSNTRMEFQQGWFQFVNDHKLELGDFLLFKYVCKSYFTVLILGISGCEKIAPVNLAVFKSHAFGEKQKNEGKKIHRLCHQCQEINCSTIEECNKHDNVKAVVNFCCDKRAINRASIGSRENYKVKSSTKQHQIDACPETTQRGYVGSYLVSCRRAVTNRERQNALDAANSFKSSKPHCFIIMKPSHVYQGFWLGFPKRFYVFSLPKQRIQITLLDSDDKKWPCVYLGDRPSGLGLSGGWRSFSVYHNLEEGDVCVFEQVEHCTFKIHIFRVVENCVPYRRECGIKSNSNVQSPAEKTSTPAAKRQKTCMSSTRTETSSMTEKQQKRNESKNTAFNSLTNCFNKATKQETNCSSIVCGRHKNIIKHEIPIKEEFKEEQGDILSSDQSASRYFYMSSKQQIVSQAKNKLFGSVKKRNMDGKEPLSCFNLCSDLKPVKIEGGKRVLMKDFNVKQTVMYQRRHLSAKDKRQPSLGKRENFVNDLFIQKQKSITGKSSDPQVDTILIDIDDNHEVIQID